MRGKFISTGATILILFSQLFSSSASATAFLDDPPAEAVVIDIVSAHGSGCRPGTTFVNVPPDSVAFTVIYGEYVAKVGVGATLTDFRKNCQLTVQVHVPEGYTYAVSRADYSGYASLAAGATGVQRASYYFQSTPNTDIQAHSFTGPFEDYWQTSDETDLAALVFHPCGELRNLNINTDLRVNVGTSDPTTTTSFIAMSESSTYRFYWKLCP
jgi:hypothetical protein